MSVTEISPLRLLLKVLFLQLSVVATCATECGGLFQDSQFREKSNDVFCCTARLVNDVRTIIACSKDVQQESHFDLVSGSTLSWQCYP